jgi:hypothetical protein
MIRLFSIVLTENRQNNEKTVSPGTGVGKKLSLADCVSGTGLSRCLEMVLESGFKIAHLVGREISPPSFSEGT